MDIIETEFKGLGVATLNKVVDLSQGHIGKIDGGPSLDTGQADEFLARDAGANGGKEIRPKEKPKYVLAKVLKPVYKEETNELSIPLVGIPDTMMMEATICYNLMKHGYSFSQVRELRRLPASWTKAAIFDYISRHGEAEYPETFYKF